MIRFKNGVAAIITTAMVASLLVAAGGSASATPTRSASVSDLVAAAIPASPQASSNGRILPSSTLDLAVIAVTANDPTNSVIRSSSTGGQVLTVLRDGADTATFDIDLPSGASLRPTAAGGFAIVSDQGTYGSIEAPWAVDANGKRLSTHYTLDGSTISQKVDVENAAFPVVADPSFRWCDWYTATCVKLNRSETLRVSDAFFAGVGAAVASFCGLIPWSPWQLALVKAACAGIVAAYFVALRGTFATARAQGRCVELKFGVVGGTGILRGWGVVNC